MQGSARPDRRFLFWLARRLYRRRTSQMPEAHAPDRLLLVRVDERVGNLIALQSAIDALRAAWPDLDLGLLASSRASQVSSQLEGVDRLHALDKRWFFRHPARWRAVIGQVREQGYQVAVDASAWRDFSFTHAALTFYSGAPMRIGYGRAGVGGFFTHMVEAGPAQEYELCQRMRLFEPLGLDGEPPSLRTRIGLASRERSVDWLGAHHVRSPRVGIWAAPFYIQLGRQLQQRAGTDLVVLWGPGEEQLRDQIASALQRGVVVAPPTDLEALGGLMRELDLVVTNDTGPMHLAVACQVPTVALFATGTPTRWGHPYPTVRNLHSPGRDPTEVETAVQACLELLGTSSDAASAR